MITKEKEDLLKFYNLGLTAIRAFEKALAVDPKDGPSVEYVKRSRFYKDNPPPENWDGVYVMTTK